MDLAALADFNLVANENGFGRASRYSGRPKATLSRRVRELEQALGVRLIERGGGRFRLTADGANLHQRTAGLLKEIEEAGQMIAEGSDRPRGILRISAPMLFSHTEMGSAATEFRRLHPDVQIEAVAEDRFVDLIGEPYDLAIRINPRPIDGELVGRCFMRDQLVLVAPRDVPRPPPNERASLDAVVVAAEPDEGVWFVDDGSWTGAVKPNPVMRLWSFAMVRDAVLEGAGVALLPDSLAAHYVATGQLASWGVVRGREVEVWALHTSRRLVSRKVQAFVNFLVKRFAEPGSSQLD
jgi:DNA-binding transcriptional LysR family regulator